MTSTSSTDDAPFWEAPLARRLAPICTGAITFALILWGLGSMGVWEPWEAQDISIAMEYAERAPWDDSILTTNPEAPGYNWAVPTLDGEPIPYSLLKTWLVSASLPGEASDISAVLGTLERSARLPIAGLMAAFAMLLFFWVRRYTDNLTATCSSVALVSMPAIYFGAHNLTTEVLGVITTALPLLAAFEFVRSDTASARWGWGVAFGAALSLSVLDTRLLGPMTVFGTLLILGLSSLPRLRARALEHDDDEEAAHALPSRIDLGVAMTLAALPLLYMGWVRLSHDSLKAASEVLSQPHLEQLLFIAFPTCAIAGGWVLIRKTDIGRVLLSPQGLGGVAIFGVTLGVLATAYADVNPTLLEYGEVTGGIPVLEYLIGQYVPAETLTRKHAHFDLWLRQIGFATFPWIALIPAGLANLARAATDTALDEEGSGARRTLWRWMLVWAFVGPGMLALFSIYGHHFFTTYVPLAIAAGALLADVDFWRRAARERPALLYITGFVAVALVLMLGKDLERYPHRFIELYAKLPKDLGLPDAFSWGATYKPFKYIMALTLIVSFFGVVSWAILTVRRVKRMPAHIKEWRAGEHPLLPDTRDDEVTPMEARAQAKAALRQEDGLLPAIARILEGAQWRGIIVTALFAAFGLASLHRYIPEATVHFSQRDLFETYTTLAEEDEPLVRYLTPEREGSLYLHGVDKLSSSRAFLERYQADERFFAVVPRDKLAMINFTVRNATGKNVPVLDASSSNLVLISNQLEDGEEDHNFIADMIVESPEAGGIPDAVQHEVRFPDPRGEKVLATFDERIELLGYSLDQQGSRQGRGEALPAYDNGEEIELSLYFRVLKRIPSNQKLFIHIDTRGNRLHGDHYPGGGDFPTNYWRQGDIIKDTHAIEVGRYAKRGVYSINFGFYQGSNRMSVKPDSAHTGDRVTIGRLRVK